MSLIDLDLSKLMTSKAFVLKPQLVYNGRSFSISALGDTGAQGYVYINTSLVVQLHVNSGVYVEKFDNPIPVKGYNRHPGAPITHFVRLTLHIDGRRQLQVPMMITDLGQYDVILGRD